MSRNVKRRLPGQGCGVNAEKAWGVNTPFLPGLTPTVNLNSPRLWSVFRRYARNHRRIARLVADNEILLDRMKQIQGVVS